MSSTHELTTLLSDLTDYQYRQAYVEGHAKDTVAFQLRRMRLEREWEQKDVAAKMGNQKLQPMISRYENPDYGRYSITTLLELARVFDVALVVRFTKFSELVRWDLHKTSATLQPANYDEDVELHGMAAETWMWRRETRTDYSITLFPAVSTSDKTPCLGARSAEIDSNLIITGSTHLLEDAA